MRDQCFGGFGDRDDARNLAVIITDGIPFPPGVYQPTILLAEDLRQHYSKFKTKSGDYFHEVHMVSMNNKKNA